MARRWNLYGLVAVLGLALTGCVSPVHANDGIFPSAPSAKSVIDFDGRGFTIRGKRTFIVSDGMEYARVPRELWRDRLLRAKRAGYNTTELYVFWNYHEPKEGVYDFSGNHDLDAYLKLIKSLGMYAIVRVGPYSCAEWDSGGYPVWLRFKPGVRVREPEPIYEAAVDRWFDHLLPIVAKNQIHRGGAVILVQLENEHPLGWGTEMPNEYFQHLQKKAVEQGIEVPYFFSGLHHGFTPAGERPWDNSTRKNPWFTTEFWTGWYDIYGDRTPADIRRFDRATWKVLANGGGGYNMYMFHGGTDFDYTFSHEDASSYDYAAAIGQAGDLRTLYYRFKRAAWFARSFESVLADGDDATADVAAIATNDAVKVTARHSPAGTIAFLDNPGKDSVKTQVRNGDGTLLPTAGPFTLAPGEVMPIIRDYKLAPGVLLKSGVGRILMTQRQGNVTTIVLYGNPGEPVELRFQDTRGATPAQERIFQETVPEAGASKYRTLDVGTEKVAVVVVSTATADRTWLWEGEAGTSSSVLVGTGYPRAVRPGKKGAEIVTEEATGAVNTAVVVPLGGGNLFATTDTTANAKPQPVPTLTNWKRYEAPEAAPSFDVTKWLASDTPKPMGADNDESAYAWYKTTLSAPQAGTYTLDFRDAGDWLAVFVNGEPVGMSALKRRYAAPIRNLFQVPLKAGANTLTVLTAHDGRDKLFNHLGEIANYTAKGIVGPVYLSAGALPPDQAVEKWQWTPATDTGDTAAQALTASDDSAWKPVRIGQDVFGAKPGKAWFRATIPAGEALSGDFTRTLRFESVDDNATVYLNGHRIGTHQQWDEPFSLAVDDNWQTGKPNVVVVLVENTENTGGLDRPVTLQALPKNGTAVTNWKMRGGPGTIPAPGSAEWKPVAATAVRPATWYQAQFTVAPEAIDSGQVLRVALPKMSRGFVWLNGHNLGRYPEVIAVDGLYLPECWLKSGANTLVIFDEEGKKPTNVHLTQEAAASRTLHTLDAKNLLPTKKK